MTELQNEHVAWQRTMLDGRLQELRAAAARVENNQALKVTSPPPRWPHVLSHLLPPHPCYSSVISTALPAPPSFLGYPTP